MVRQTTFSLGSVEREQASPLTMSTNFGRDAVSLGGGADFARTGAAITAAAGR